MRATTRSRWTTLPLGTPRPLRFAWGLVVGRSPLPCTCWLSCVGRSGWCSAASPRVAAAPTPLPAERVPPTRIDRPRVRPPSFPGALRPPERGERWSSSLPTEALPPSCHRHRALLVARAAASAVPSPHFPLSPSLSQTSRPGVRPGVRRRTGPRPHRPRPTGLRHRLPSPPCRRHLSPCRRLGATATSEPPLLELLAARLRRGLARCAVGVGGRRAVASESSRLVARALATQ